MNHAAVDALIQTQAGKLRIIGTHLSLSIFERRSEARNLLRLINAVEEKEKNPILLMGDINEWQRPSKLIRFLNDHLTPIGCKATFTSWCPFLHLVRVWYSGDHIVVSGKTMTSKKIAKLSDHLPIMVNIHFSTYFKLFSDYECIYKIESNGKFIMKSDLI